MGGYTIVTLAPEMVPAGFIHRLCAASIRVSAGHTNATFAQMMSAFEEGLSCGTHLWNAMSPMASREPGAVGALLRDDRAWYGIIGDGAHVDMNTLALSVKAKPPGQAFLVSDALSPVGEHGDASFWLGPLHIQVVDGVCVTDNGTLAGACCDLATGVRNCVERAGISKAEALRMASLYPARYLGADNRLGSIRPGLPARLVILDDRIRVTATIIDGEMESVGSDTGT
jgi:N-acetylglucosamine-6-phosphate deacetylase